jgi:hypothetical protein
MQFVCDYRPILDTYDKIRYEGATFPIKYVVPDAETWSVFEENATNMKDPYNVEFAALTGEYHYVLHAGSVYDINNGYYNLIDPTGYVFPKPNNSSVFERIPVTEKAQFLDFINRRQPDWKLPIIEQVLNWMALITLLAVLGLLLVYLVIRYIRFSEHVHKI